MVTNYAKNYVLVLETNAGAFVLPFGTNPFSFVLSVALSRIYLPGAYVEVLFSQREAHLEPSPKSTGGTVGAQAEWKLLESSIPSLRQGGMRRSSQQVPLKGELRKKSVLGRTDESAHVGKHSPSREDTADDEVENGNNANRTSDDFYNQNHNAFLNCNLQVSFPVADGQQGSIHIGDTASGEKGESTSHTGIVRKCARTGLEEPPGKQTGNTSGDDNVNVLGKNKRGLSDEERIAERNRKGRERSMRTRRRNASRLESLQENCAYLHIENGVLRQIIINIRDNPDWSAVRSLLGRLVRFRSTRPPQYVFASKEAEAAAYQELRPLLLFNTQAIQDAPSTALQPDSVTETNLRGAGNSKRKDRHGDRDDTRSTNGQRHGTSVRDVQPADNDADDLFAWLTDGTAPFRAEGVKESVQHLEDLPRFTFEELANLVGKTDQ